MEESLFFQDVVDSLGKFHKFVDCCLSQEDGSPSKRQLLRNATQRLIDMVIEKDKGYQLLYERNKMLEARMKTMAHLLRAMDKMTQIPEVPTLFRIKEENQTVADMTAPEEESQLSVIQEITEPETSKIRDENKTDSEELKEGSGTPSNYLRAKLIEEPSSPGQVFLPPPQVINSHNFETSTPKLSAETHMELDCERRKFFPKPKIDFSRPLTKDDITTKRNRISGSVETRRIQQPYKMFNDNEDSVKQIDDQHDTINIMDDSKYSDISSEGENEIQQPEVQPTFYESDTILINEHKTSLNQTGSKFKLKEPVLKVDELLTEKFKQSVNRIQMNDNGELSKKPDEECHIENHVECGKEEILSSPSLAERASADGSSEVTELLEITREVITEGIQGRRPITYDEETQDGEVPQKSPRKDVLTDEEQENTKAMNEILALTTDDEGDTVDCKYIDQSNEITGKEKNYFPKRRNGFWKPSETCHSEITNDIDIELTTTRVLVNEEDLENRNLQTVYGDENETENKTQHTDKEIITHKENARIGSQEQEIQNDNSNKDLKRKQKKIQNVDLITINNYTSSSIDETTLAEIDNKDIEIGGTSTFLSLTSKTMVCTVGDNINILSNSFLKTKQGQKGRENMQNGETNHTEHANQCNDEQTKIIEKEIQEKQNKQNVEDTTQENRSQQRAIRDDSDTSASDDKTEMVLEINETENDEAANKVGKNENKYKIAEGPQKSKPILRKPRVRESSDKNIEEERNEPTRSEEKIPLRRTLRERKKKIFDDSSDTDDSEIKTTKKKATLQPKAKQKVNKKEDSEDDEPMKKRKVGRPKRPTSNTRSNAKKT